MDNPANTRVIVGMSGGVDSSVCALLLKQQGYDVSGVFMKNWEEDDPAMPCTAAQDARDAQQVCDRLSIVLDAVNFSEEYWTRVFQYFLDEFHHGRTPNPDVLCNAEIKFRAFLDYALQCGADYIATGHYARVSRSDSAYRLLKAADGAKDQTYFLYTLGQTQLARTLFPLAGLTKTEVRRTAEKAGFANALKKDSTGICFIGERDFNKFLSRYLPARHGEIRTPEGVYMGTHNGLMYYTVGQRKGIGIGGRHDADERPWYVAGKDLLTNSLIVVQGHDHSSLYSKALIAGSLQWVAGEPPPMPCRCRAKTRYRQPEQACVVSAESSGNYYVTFDEPQWAVTPGQSVVFYAGDECFGGGIIEQAVR